MGHGASSSKPGIISTINLYNPCLPEDRGQGKLLGSCLQLVLGSETGQTSGLLLFSEHIPVCSPGATLFSLWDELVWGFNSRNSRRDAQNKPARLKIAHAGCCCCFQDKDVTR